MSDEKSNSTSQQLEIQKVYLKDVSLETPNSPMIFAGQQQWQPEIQVQLNNNATQVAENVHEVVLSLTVTAKSGDKTAYLVEIQQAGIFILKGFNPQQMGQVLGAFCPNILYPFAREAVASLVNKGGFPPVLLNPVNFDALYLQRQQNMQAQAKADS